MLKSYQNTISECWVFVRYLKAAAQRGRGMDFRALRGRFEYKKLKINLKQPRFA